MPQAVTITLDETTTPSVVRAVRLALIEQLGFMGDEEQIRMKEAINQLGEQIMAVTGVKGLTRYYIGQEVYDIPTAQYARIVDMVTDPLEEGGRTYYTLDDSVPRSESYPELNRNEYEITGVVIYQDEKMSVK